MKEIYEKDYTRPKSEPPAESFNLFEPSDDEFDFMNIYRLYDQSSPKHIVAKDKLNYEYLLKRCDEFAQEHHGQLYGLVDHDTFGAKIKLTMPHFIEFCTDEDLQLLGDIADKVRNVLFEPTAEGGVTMTLFIDYFDEDESFEDFYAKHLKAAIQRRGLALEEAAALCDVDIEELKKVLGE